jgi:hypothetical protein
MKYVSFPWLPVVAAHDHKKLARALHNSASYWLQTAQKTISDQNRVFMTISRAQRQMSHRAGIYLPSSGFPHVHLYATFSLSSSLDSVAFAVSDKHRQHVQNDRLVTSDILYREVL